MIVCLQSIKRGKITVWLSIDAVILNTWLPLSQSVLVYPKKDKNILSVIIGLNSH